MKQEQAQRELTIQNRVTEVFRTIPDDEVFDAVLAILLEVSESKHGVFGFINTAGDLVVPSMTRHIWEECEVPDKDIVFPHSTWGDSSWPRAIREQRPNFTNLRSDRVPVARHISIPLIHQGDVVGLIQVGNRESDYTEEDIALLDGIGRTIAPILDARLHRVELRRAVTALERSNEELKQFAYVASHDLQEPLRTIISFIEILREDHGDDFPAEAEEPLTFIYEAASRMKQLIRGLLEYSRVETRGGGFVPVELESMVRRVVRTMDVGEHHINIAPLPTALGDPVQIERVFQNLLSNAVKYRKLGSSAEIDVFCADLEGTQIIIGVRDRGIGINPDYFDQVFVIFRRLHTATDYPGTGIGLAVAQKILQRHGGRIWVESQGEGEGSTFYFTLPSVSDATAKETPPGVERVSHRVGGREEVQMSPLELVCANCGTPKSEALPEVVDEVEVCGVCGSDAEWIDPDAPNDREPPRQ